MNISNNTVLITGGTAGIGLEMAKLLAKNGNKIIITGRDQARMDAALALLSNTTGILSDVSNTADLEKLAAVLEQDFPSLNVVINNAGRAQLYELATVKNLAAIAEDEMQTNYFSIIRLNERLLPLLSKQKEAAIVNVSSVVAFVPGSLATYSASKAALHSYTQSLRLSLSATGRVKVFELMPPLVNTDFSQGIGGSNGIGASIVAEQLLNGLHKDIYEIRVGNTQVIYDLYLKSPGEALQAMNASRK